MIGTQLKELRLKASLKQEDILKEFNLSSARYSQYETGKRSPDYELLIKFADFYNVSVDYLLGRSNHQTQTTTRTTIKTRFMEKISKLDDDQLREIEQIADYVESKKGKNEEAATTA